jgi:hypothetical protein
MKAVVHRPIRYTARPQAGTDTRVPPKLPQLRAAAGAWWRQVLRHGVWRWQRAAASRPGLACVWC